ncbi:hypothetical protein vBPFY1MI_166 [Pseudomonas phage vB_PF_Y1-MI]|nr:hypothetical protein vBPFY1MI_166 [Pseudomonas phage vB_PF_Y1-MI]
MKELMVEIKLSAWDNGTLFILTDKLAYPFDGTDRFADVSAPTMTEIEECVEHFKDDDMYGYGGIFLDHPLILEAKTIYKVSTKRRVFHEQYVDRDGDVLVVISNNTIDPSKGDLFFSPLEDGVVLKREQALDLAARINDYFTTN